MEKFFIIEYIHLAAVCADTNFGCKASIKRYFHALDRMANITKNIGIGNDLKSVEDFSKLLIIKKNRLDIRAAMDLLGRSFLNSEIELKALKVIQNASLQHNSEALRYQIMLEGWKERGDS